MFYKVTLGLTTGATYNMTNAHVFKAAQARWAYFYIFKITSSGAVLIIFCCAISDFDIEQIDIWSEIVSRVSMLGESRSW